MMNKNIVLYTSFVLLFCKKGGIKMRALIGLVVICLLMTTIGASAETTTDITWDGGGEIEIHFVSDDDATNDFQTGGSTISGEYHAIDKDDDPYGYGVDTTDIKVKAHVVDGYIEYRFTRDDSHTSMYGDAGQESYTFIDSYGTADFRWHSWSNYAKYQSCHHGWQNDNQIQATGKHVIHHYIDNGNDEGAEILINADGSTNLTIMNEQADSNGFKFGRGCGCYHNAHVDITGTGNFTMIAQADNTIDTDFGIHTDGYLSIYAEFANGFHFGNFALEGS